MALTETEKAIVRTVLGYPSQWRDSNTRLESAMTDDLTSEAEVIARDLLASIDAVETKIMSAGIDSIGIERVDEIVFADDANVPQALASVGRMFVGRLSILLGVPILADYFGRSFGSRSIRLG